MSCKNVIRQLCINIGSCKNSCLNKTYSVNKVKKTDTVNKISSN